MLRGFKIKPFCFMDIDEELERRMRELQKFRK